MQWGNYGWNLWKVATASCFSRKARCHEWVRTGSSAPKLGNQYVVGKCLYRGCLPQLNELVGNPAHCPTLFGTRQDLSRSSEALASPHCRIVATLDLKGSFLSKFFKLDRNQHFVPLNVCPVIVGGHFKDMPWRVFSLSVSRRDGRGLKFYNIFSLHSSSRWLHMQVMTADYITRVPSPPRWIPPSGSVMSSAMKASFIFCPHHCFSVCPEQTGPHLRCFSRAVLRAASPHPLVHWDPTGCVSMGHKPIVMKLKSVEWRRPNSLRRPQCHPPSGVYSGRSCVGRPRTGRLK